MRRLFAFVLQSLVWFAFPPLRVWGGKANQSDRFFRNPKGWKSMENQSYGRLGLTGELKEKLCEGELPGMAQYASDEQQQPYDDGADEDEEYESVGLRDGLKPGGNREHPARSRQSRSAR